MTPELRWTPFLSLLNREIRRFWRVIMQTVMIPLINSILYFLIFGVSLGKNILMNAHDTYLSFLIPGLVMMGVLNNAFQNSSSSIGTSKFHGDLEDLRMAPLKPWQIVWAMSLGGLVRGVLIGIITFLSGEIFYRLQMGYFLGVKHPLLLFWYLVLGGLSFAKLGISVAFRAKDFDQLSAIGGFILLPLMYLGGVFFSLEQLHPFWQTLSHFNPMIYFINGVRFSILGTADIGWELSSSVAFITTAILSGFALQSVRNGIYRRW